MNLYDEDEVRYKNEKNKKIKKFITIGIITAIIVIIALMFVIFTLIRNPNKITVFYNGKESEKLESLIITQVSPIDDSVILYTPIRDLATLWGFESYKGEYTSNEESEDSCYVVTEKEIVIFKLNSNIIYKIAKDNRTSNMEYEYIKIANPVIKSNNNLYIDIDGIRKAFNVSINDYDSKTKRIRITTLDTYITSATTVATQNGFKEIDDNYTNQKALLDNMIVVKNEAGAKGVITFTGNNSGKEVLGAQYEDILYVPQKQVFIVKRNNKVGIMGEDGSSKITLQYDSLTLIDDENNLYLAGKDNKYGVIDINENTVIYIEYDKIGIDINEFARNGVKNGYILLNKLIPVQQQGKWKFYSISKQGSNENGRTSIVGKLLNIPDLDGIGCITKVSRGIVSNILLMEEYNIVVVQKSGFYGLLYPDGTLASSLNYTDMYMETSSGSTNYYMIEYGGNNTINMLQYFEERGISKKQS